MLPDLEATLTWSWDGTHYVASDREPDHTRLPGRG